MQNLPRYADLLNNKKDADTQLINAKVSQAEARAKLKVAEIEEDLATREAKLREVCMSTEIDFDQMIDLIDEIDNVNHTLGQYNSIVDQMFGKKSAKKSD
jgi:hypothetical protein